MTNLRISVIIKPIITYTEEESMETKLCKHCQSEIPKKAKVCPHCRKKQGGKLKWFIIAFVIIMVIGSFSDESEEPNKSIENEVSESAENNKSEESAEVTDKETIEETEEEYKASCVEYKYKDVLRNPGDYIGKRIKVTAKISSVHEASWMNDTKYYFAYSNDEYDLWLGDMYGVFDERSEENPKLLEDDIITVYGEISDPEYTTSLIVSGSELFCIDMKYIDFISE